MLDNIVFLNLKLGILSFFIGLIFLFLFYSTKKFKLKFKFLSDLEKIFGNSKKHFIVNLILIFILITLFSLIIADPNLKQQKTKINKDGIDIVLVFDLSYSMMAEDIKPNRLEVAKQVLIDFVSKINTDRVGLIVFSGKPFTSIPLTFDYDFIKKFISNITINTINQDYHHLQGTAIGDALLYGANLFEDNSKREKVIVLLTDGEANRGIDPIEAIRYVIAKNIKVHTVGIGGEEDTYVTIDNIFGKQKIAIGGVDEKNLQTIASLTNGFYYRASDNETFKKIFENLNLLEKKDLEIEVFDIYKNFYRPFIYIIFFVFFIFFVFNFYFYLKN